MTLQDDVRDVLRLVARELPRHNFSSPSPFHLLDRRVEFQGQEMAVVEALVRIHEELRGPASDPQVGGEHRRTPSGHPYLRCRLPLRCPPALRRARPPRWFLSYLEGGENAANEVYALTHVSVELAQHMDLLAQRHRVRGGGTLMVSIDDVLPCWFFEVGDFPKAFGISEAEAEELEETLDWDPYNFHEMTERLRRPAARQRACNAGTRLEYERLRVLIGVDGIDDVWAHVVLRHDSDRDYYTTAPFPSEWYQ